MYRDILRNICVYRTIVFRFVFYTFNVFYFKNNICKLVLILT